MPNTIETWEMFHKDTLKSVCHSNKRNPHLQKISIKDHKIHKTHTIANCIFIWSHRKI